MIYLCHNKEILIQQEVSLETLQEVGNALDCANINWEWERRYCRWRGENIRKIASPVIAYDDPADEDAAMKAGDMVTETTTTQGGE